MGPHPEYGFDLEKVILARTGGKKPSRLLLWAMNRFLHADFFNEFLTRGDEGVEMCTRAVEYLDLTVETEGIDDIHLPPGAKMTFASNHPLGGADGIILGSIIGRHFTGDLGIAVNSFLMNLKGLAPLCVSVEKMGGQSRNLPEQIRGMYRDREAVLVFPAGQCSRIYDGVIQDCPWSKSFVSLSRDNGRWIIPVHFIGTNSRRFYRTDLLCRKLGIKFNIPMLMLPGEMYKSVGKDFKVVFGKPIPPEHFDDSRKPVEWAAEIRDSVYKLQ